MRIYPIVFSELRTCWVRQDTRGRRSRRARRAIRAARAGNLSAAWWEVWRARKGELTIDACPLLGLVQGDLVRFTEAMQMFCGRPAVLDGVFVVTGFVYSDYPRVEMDHARSGGAREASYWGVERDEIEPIAAAGVCRRECFRNVR